MECPDIMVLTCQIGNITGDKNPQGATQNLGESLLFSPESSSMPDESKPDEPQDDQ